jgi:site-specific recombinase XerD
MTLIAPAIQAFFTTRLITQQGASAHTIRSYRDSIRLLTIYAASRSGKSPSSLTFSDINHDCVTEFLDHLATERGNSLATCNTRLAAVHALFTASALGHPEHANDIARVLAISGRKTVTPDVTFLLDDEASAIIAAPDTTTTAGRRDQALWTTGLQTGLRASELTGLARHDIHIHANNPHLTVIGKGRKQRSVPLTPRTIALLERWLQEIPTTPHSPVFPTRTHSRMSQDSIEARLKLTVNIASQTCPSLKTKHITCHTLRHTCAMTLLKAGVDSAVIALWLGHESIETTKVYLHADLDLKRLALERIPPQHHIPTAPYQPDDILLAFLQSL